MSLSDSDHYLNVQKVSRAPDIVEVKDACVGDDNIFDEDGLKRALILDRWRRRIRAKDFVDQLLEKEEKIVGGTGAERSFSLTQPEPPLQMPFGTRIENGLMMEDQFCYARRNNGLGSFAGLNGFSGLSVSTPTLSALTTSSPSFDPSSGWNRNNNYTTNWIDYIPRS
ncbi:hypothetical protein Aperf_G00000113859 [Anoplocephala perfoliata]